MRIRVLFFERNVKVLAIIQIAFILLKLFDIFSGSIAWWVVFIPAYLIVFHTLVILFQLVVGMAKVMIARNQIDNDEQV